MNGDTITTYGAGSPINNAKDNSTANMTIINGRIQSEDPEIFAKEIIEAINRINAIDELQQEQKESLIKLMNEAKTATEENNESAKKSCKEGFESFRKWGGNVVNKVLPVIADLMTVAAFFGISLIGKK